MTINPNNLRPQFCNFCNKANAIPRVSEFRHGPELIKECKWLCPNCSQVVRREIIEKKPVEVKSP